MMVLCSQIAANIKTARENPGSSGLKMASVSDTPAKTTEKPAGKGKDADSTSNFAPSSGQSAPGAGSMSAILDAAFALDSVVFGLFHVSEDSVVRGATRRRDGLPVVLKIFDTPTRVLCGEHEAKMLRQAACGIHGAEYLVSLLDVIAGHGWLVLVFEKLAAVPAPAEFATVAEQLLAAVMCVHNSGVVHLDVKPDNVLYHGKTQSAKLGDFGLALPLNSEVPAGRGTPAFTAPELRNQSVMDGKPCDVWSVGATLVHLRLGKVVAVLDAEADASVASDVILSDPKWRNFLNSLLAPDPLRRPSAAKAQLALGGILRPPLAPLRTSNNIKEINRVSVRSLRTKTPDGVVRAS
jgi:hypothetical protein